MRNDIIQLVCWPTMNELAAGVALSVLDDWPSRNRPQLQIIDPPTWARQDLAKAEVRVAWFVPSPGVSSDELYNLMEPAASLGLPVLLSRPTEPLAMGSGFMDAAVVGPLNDRPGHLRLILAALVSQSQATEHLRRDLAVAHHFGGLLRGQMDKVDEEMRLAARVQREFLPRNLPTVDGAKFDVLMRPAAYISGDIYDVQRLDENHIGFYVVDAMGHGVPAALMTVFIKRSMPTKEIRAGGYRLVPPDEALAALNRDMLEQQGERVHFATACYGILNFRTRELRIAGAGHPRPILIAADGAVRRLETDGPALGIFEEAGFDLVTTTLAEGDRVLLYTDGFEEVFQLTASGVSAQRIREVSDLSSGRFDQVIKSLEQRLDAVPGSLHQQDDITALVVAMTAKAEQKAPAKPAALPVAAPARV